MLFYQLIIKRLITSLFYYQYDIIRRGDYMFTKIDLGNDKDSIYKGILEQAKYLLDKDENIITNLSNASALLNVYLKDINWVGFYIYDGYELYLGPFQGLPACTKIKVGNGVCGVAAETRKTLVVKNVDEFPGHITCDSASKSEIVVPIIKDGLYGVLDIDSPILNRFDDTDKLYLEKFVALIVDLC